MKKLLILAALLPTIAGCAHTIDTELTGFSTWKRNNSCITLETWGFVKYGGDPKFDSYQAPLIFTGLGAIGAWARYYDPSDYVDRDPLRICSFTAERITIRVDTKLPSHILVISGELDDSGYEYTTHELTTATIYVPSEEAKTKLENWINSPVAKKYFSLR